MRLLCTMKKNRCGGRLSMRAPILALAAILGLGLFCGSANAARFRYPTVVNPYCDIQTYVIRDVAEQAMSLLDSAKRPVIVVNANTLRDSPAYGDFLMAHECCHHSLGHVQRYHEGLGHLGPQPFFYILPQLKQMELDADCCAVRTLKSKHETGGIDAARMTMLNFGAKPTGAHYPTGTERADNIAVCNAKD